MAEWFKDYSFGDKEVTIHTDIARIWIDYDDFSEDEIKEVDKLIELVLAAPEMAELLKRFLYDPVMPNEEARDLLTRIRGEDGD